MSLATFGPTSLPLESSSEFRYPSLFLSKALKIASLTSFLPSGGGPFGGPLLLGLCPGSGRPFDPVINSF